MERSTSDDAVHAIRSTLLLPLPAFRCARTRAFTLIELLVVVAIIGLLIAILIPGLQLAQNAANQLVCQTHLDQLFKGTMLFTEDQPENRLPYFRWLTSRPSGSEWWVTEVTQMIGVMEPEVFRCPSDPSPPEIAFWRVGSGWHMPGVRLSPEAPRPVNVNLPVTYRGSCDLTELKDNINIARRITAFERPDANIILIEADNPGQKDRECFVVRQMLQLGLNLTKRRFYEGYVRHAGTSNMVFLDGHVARFTEKELVEVALRQEYRDLF